MTLIEGSDDLERLRDNIDIAWEQARKFGLDPVPTHFEMVPASIMYEFASYSLPGRFSHWTHGKAYHRQKMQYDFGLSKIYEMVVNTNPSNAFLMDKNNLLQNRKKSQPSAQPNTTISGAWKREPSSPKRSATNIQWAKLPNFQRSPKKISCSS